MKQLNHTLWNRLCAFHFDDGFATRLAQENGWSAEFTDTAIEEYRKFLFLCGVTGTPLSPSHIIDEVWHLHLLYTQSYWRDLCGAVLGRELHHVPSDGSEAQGTVLKDQYERTLELYSEWFGEQAPAEIWPRVSLTGAESDSPNKQHSSSVPYALILYAVAGFLVIAFVSVGGPWLILIILSIAGVVVWGLNHVQKNEKRKRIRNKGRHTNDNSGGTACAGMLFWAVGGDNDSGSDSSCSSDGGDGGGCGSGCGGGCGGD